MILERRIVYIVLAASLCLSLILLYKVDIFGRDQRVSFHTSNALKICEEGSENCNNDNNIINNNNDDNNDDEDLPADKGPDHLLPTDFHAVKNEDLIEDLNNGERGPGEDDEVTEIPEKKTDDFVDIQRPKTKFDDPVEPKNKSEPTKDSSPDKKPAKSGEKKNSDPAKKLGWTDAIDQMLSDNPEFKPLVEPLVKEDGKFYDQTDETLIELIEEKYLIPPSKESYSLKDPKKENSMGQAQKIIQILKNQTNGFFIECGGFDGETRSNSLTLERKFGWNGILVEADLDNLVKLKGKHRKAWTVPACLSTQRNTMFVSFRAWGHIGRIVSEDLKKQVAIGRGPEGESPDRRVNATCLPLFSILKALKVDTVDYFSLDVEGNELQILKTIPFDKINIRTLSVEFSHAGDTGSSMEELKSFMLSKGFVVHSLVLDPNFLAHDFIFIQKSIKMELDAESADKERVLRAEIEKKRNENKENGNFSS